MNANFCKIGLSPSRRKRKQQNLLLLYFNSHKEKIFRGSEEQKFKDQIELKSLIHSWLNYQKQINNSQIFSEISRSSLSGSENLYKKEPHQDIQNQKFKHNHLSSQLVSSLYSKHPILKKTNFNLADTLINVGLFSLYKNNHQIPYLFYNQKYKNQCNQNKKLGFIIYGKLNIHDEFNQYFKTIDHQDSIGQHGISTLGINFANYRNLKVKSVAEQTAILWISKHNYEILFKQAMKCGLKEQMKKLEAYLKISWIKKSPPKF